MGSSFFEFNIAKTGLFAAKTGLQVTSNNVYNMATVGYSRQYAKQVASSPIGNFGGLGQMGTGTTIETIGRVRDEYLDRKYWPKVSTLGEYEQKSTQLSMMETSFSALSESGVSNNVNGFFTSISDLAFNADSLEYRTAVISNAETLISNLKSHANALHQQQEELNDDLYTVVSTVNSLGKQISNINTQIYQNEITGHTANELRDKRTVLLDELSKYGNIQIKEYDDGTGRELGKKMDVLLNGQEFVSHDTSRELKLEPRIATDPANQPNDVVGLYNIKWDNGTDFNLNGLTGEMKGILDLRDGNSGTGNSMNYKGIPYYIGKLNEFTRTMASAMNDGIRYNDAGVLNGVIGHTDGFDMNGDAGGPLFTYKDNAGIEDTNIDSVVSNVDKGEYANIDVFNIQVSTAIKDDSRLLAISSVNDATQVSNNEVVLGFLKLKDDMSLFNEGGAIQFSNAMSATLSIDTKQAEKFDKYYKETAKAVDNQRMEVSAVSLNEEINNMVKYQHLYQVSSKLINVINEIYNTTINGLGV